MRTIHIARCLIAGVLTLAAASAGAQDVRPFADLGLGLNLGDRVRVVDRDGVRHDGTVRTLPPDALVIVGAGGPQGFTEETTVSVARRGDPVWTGALIGFIPGYFIGAQFVLGFSDQKEPLTTYLMAGGIVGLAGAGIGALIDSLHDGLKPVYSAERKSALTVAPVVGRGRAGAIAAFRW
ncbi:MAG: hypothetical protein IT181_03760 [Acidobacteria bacterium]|nr:hypothetical protein [Acidobacteriota bacterium]